MIRAYTETDKSEVIQLFRLNTPRYFDASEGKDFKYYLDQELDDYFVYESDGQILGSGGLNYSLQEKSACLSWGMVDPHYHGQGIGRELTQFRINHLLNISNVEEVIVRTSQHVYRFYEKMGFNLEVIKKDFWAQGFDLYQMKINLKSLI